MGSTLKAPHFCFIVSGFWGPWIARSPQNNLQTVLRLARRGLFPDAYFWLFLCICHKLVFATSERKIVDSGGGKRVRRVRPDRLLSKNRSFIWEFTGRSLKTEVFFPVFGVFDPLNFEINAIKRARNAHFQHVTVFRLRMPSSNLVFSQGPF